MSQLTAINDLLRHNGAIKADLDDAFARLVDSGWYILGRQVTDFERAFAEYCGVADVVGVANGTDAIELALRAVGVTQSHRVALAANAGGYGTIAVNAIGAEPVYIDIERDTYGMSPASLEDALRRTDVSAVIVTHLYGQLAAVEEIADIARRHGVRLIEDCAQAHGARRAGKAAGSFGDAASFSFYPTKNLGALGDGGAVATNDPQVAAAVRSLRQYGWSSKYRTAVPHGRNSRLDELQAGVLLAKLPHLDGWNSRRGEIADRYDKLIQHPRVFLPKASGSDHVAHLYVLRCADRDGLAEHLRSVGIPYDIHYPLPDYRQEIFGGRFAELTLPETEEACAQVLTLPCFPEMTDEEVNDVADAVNQWRS